MRDGEVGCLHVDGLPNVTRFQPRLHATPRTPLKLTILHIQSSLGVAKRFSNRLPIFTRNGYPNCNADG